MTGAELRAIRLSLNMNQTEFGDALGIAYPQIQVSDMENGKRKITNRLLASIRNLVRARQMEKTK